MEGTVTRHCALAVLFLSGGIHTKLRTCSYEETFELEWSSYFLIWAGTNKDNVHEQPHYGNRGHCHPVFVSVYTNWTKLVFQAVDSESFFVTQVTSRLQLKYNNQSFLPLNRFIYKKTSPRFPSVLLHLYITHYPLIIYNITSP
jgi:hypothetical protein